MPIHSAVELELDFCSSSTLRSRRSVQERIHCKITLSKQFAKWNDNTDTNLHCYIYTYTVWTGETMFALCYQYILTQCSIQHRLTIKVLSHVSIERTWSKEQTTNYMLFIYMHPQSDNHMMSVYVDVLSCLLFICFLFSCVLVFLCIICLKGSDMVNV